MPGSSSRIQSSRNRIKPIRVKSSRCCQRKQTIMNASAAKSLLTSQCNGNGNEKAMSASHFPLNLDIVLVLDWGISRSGQLPVDIWVKPNEMPLATATHPINERHTRSWRTGSADRETLEATRNVTSPPSGKLLRRVLNGQWHQASWYQMIHRKKLSGLALC